MGLDVRVGALIGAEEDTAEWFRAECAAIAAVLAADGLPGWREPESGPRFGERIWGYSGLHALRRLAAHLAAHGRLPEPSADGERATDDPVLRAAYEHVPDERPGPFDHLIHHSDCEGYYAPVDFASVLADPELTGGLLGSSVRLLAELDALARALGLPDDLDPEAEEVTAAHEDPDPAAEGWRRYGTEAFVCLQLRLAARHSVENGAVLVFC
ncbi:hypothetical protein [Kitasatospora fiedleri]|uniref:hypothetical protein n=1 Tax=Kitasatospora fiedleri TaxID=2991545 RepID=UPI00249CD7D5|nr:hypothetical protein [Kitasatospora fiedleri]